MRCWQRCVCRLKTEMNNSNNNNNNINNNNISNNNDNGINEGIPSTIYREELIYAS